MRNWLHRMLPIICLALVGSVAQAQTGTPQAGAAAGAAANGKVISTAGADPKVVERLDNFCKKWMGFLVVRETNNKAKVAWSPAGTGVEGQYVGYGTEYSCTLKHNGDPKTVPVAILKYREYLYRRRGTSGKEAMLTAPDVLEVTEVTEIFRYMKGKWVF